MISMDSANGHLAANYNIPVLTLWGMTHPFCGFKPFDQSQENSITIDRNHFPYIPTSIFGNKIPKGLSISARPLIKGDSLCYPCSLASIIAKVSRDRFMVEMGHKYPEYGFEKHKGYGTSEHFSVIKKYGITKLHRKSFLKKSILI